MLKKNSQFIRIAIPSVHSRLHKKVMEILGISYSIPPQKLVFKSNTIEIYFLRPWDIPRMVELNYIDLGFCGTDIIYELKSNVELCLKFDTYRTKICFLKLSNQRSSNISFKVATEYPRIATQYLQSQFNEFEIFHVRGAAEAYAHFDDISAVIDIYESGRTAKENSLEIVKIVNYTFPCLIKSIESKLESRLIKLDEISKEISSVLNLLSPQHLKF